MGLAQVLVISPDTAVLQAAERCISSLGHTPFLARTLSQAQRLLGRVELRLLCFDSVLPPREAERFWSSFRPLREDAAVLFLAPRSAQLVPSALPSFFRPKRDGLVQKPVQQPELLREISRLLSATPAEEEDRCLQVGSVVLDAETHRLLFADGGPVALTPTEFRLLRWLMERPGRFVPSDELLENVWGYPPHLGGPEVVRAHVSNLRRKLREAGRDPHQLRTAPNQGYGFLSENGST
jgi:DNA-binding response OmpR family regulator